MPRPKQSQNRPILGRNRESPCSAAVAKYRKSVNEKEEVSVSASCK